MSEASNGQEALQLVLEAAATAGEFQIAAVLLIYIPCFRSMLLPFLISVSRCYSACSSPPVSLRADPFDAVFMDCMMPVMDGPTAAKAMFAAGKFGV